MKSKDHVPLAHFFSPASVAVIGATDREGSAEEPARRKLLGPVYAINPKRTEIGGLRCYPSIGALPEAIDLVARAIWFGPRKTSAFVVDTAVSRETVRC